MKTTTSKKNIIMKNSILFATALLLAPCALLADVDWTAYAKSFDITFPGYKGTTTLTNFPVLVRLSATRNKFDYSKSANGYDLRFSDAEGNLLSHEIDTLDTTGESLVWVKVPSFKRDTVITAHYGLTSGQPPVVTASDVWSADYVGVWHMKESGVPLAESSGVSTPIDTAVAAVEFGYAGAIGNAVDMSGVTGGWANKMSAADDDDLDGFTDFTLEMWTRQEEWGGSSSVNPILLAKRSTTACSYHWYCKQVGDSRAANMVLSTNVTAYTDLTGNTTSPVLGQWTHQAYVRNTSENHIYSFLNGAITYTRPNSFGENTIGATDERLSFGSGNRGGVFPGQIDEVRISRVARSADWIQATSDCVTDNDFASYDLGVENDWAKYSHKFTVTFSGYEGSETLANFPVLVKISEGSPSGFSYADCLKPNGGDLRFADDFENLLASEIDTWNSNGVSLVWVKVPTLTSSTKITAYYGCENVPAVDSASVWANGYVGVWHLGDAGNQTQADSTANHLDFLCHNKDVGNVDLSASGTVGGAVGFNKGPSRRGGLYQTDTDGKLSGFSEFTIEGWIYPTNVAPQSASLNDAILANRPDTTQGPWHIYATRGSKNGLPNMTMRTEEQSAASIQTEMPVAAAPVLNEWSAFAFSWESIGGSYNAYINGESKVNTTTTVRTPVVKSTDAFVILGNESANTPYVTWASTYYLQKQFAFPGYIDEVRISNVKRSSDWIKATHDCVTEANFATYSKAKATTSRAAVLIFN